MVGYSIYNAECPAGNSKMLLNRILISCLFLIPFANVNAAEEATSESATSQNATTQNNTTQNTTSQNTVSQNTVSQNTPKVKIEETVLGMNVSGTNDLPNVLYIIPWKANSTAVSPPEVSRLVDEIYAPVDPEVFAKQVKFYYQLTEVKDAEVAKSISKQ